jgi:hypothetical protein
MITNKLPYKNIAGGPRRDKQGKFETKTEKHKFKLYICFGLLIYFGLARIPDIIKNFSYNR